MKWTDKEDAHLQKLIDQGYSYSEIAILMGCKFNRVFSKNSISGRVSRIRFGMTKVATRVNLQAIRNEKKYDSVFETDSMIGKYKLIDLKHNQCRYAFGTKLNYTFCGAKVVAGKSMCEEHHKLCYIDPPKKGRKKGRKNA